MRIGNAVKLNEGAGTGGTPGTSETPKPTAISADEFLAANPELKKRLEEGDAARQTLSKLDEDQKRKAGELDKLLEKERTEKEAERTRASKAEEQLKKYERRDALGSVVEAKAAELEKAGMPLKAVLALAQLLDDGKTAVEKVVDAATEKIKAWGVAKATDNLDGGGGGGGSGGNEDEAAVKKLIELGRAARNSGRADQLSQYSAYKAELVAKGVKLPADLTARINAAEAK